MAPLEEGSDQARLALDWSTLSSCKAVTLSGTSARVWKGRVAALANPFPRLFTAWIVSV